MIEKCCPSFQKNSLKNYKFSVYRGIDELNTDEINPILYQKSVYFNPSYLKVMEISNSAIEPLYTVIYNKDKPVGFACFQLLKTQFSAPDSNVKGLVPTIHKTSMFLTGKSPLNIRFNVLVCGNAFITGEHGVAILEGVNKNEVMDVLAEAIIEIRKQKKQEGTTIGVVLFKDFMSESLHISNEIEEYGYSAFRADPNMVMEVNPAWKSFEDYKTALKSKFRTKLNKALKDSAELEVVNVNEHYFIEHLKEFKALYGQVEEKASFHLGAIKMNTFVELKKAFKEDFIVKCYLFEGKMVGYLTAFVQYNTLDAHFIGLDYECNRRLGVYQRILYDYVNIAIERKLSRIKFGRTAGEIKTTIGAVPVDLTLYVKQSNKVLNFFTKYIMAGVKPNKFPVRRPFKAN